MSEWTAAIISWRSPSGRSGGSSLAFRVEHEYGKSHWQTPTLGQVADSSVTEARPLVVIDPEDREQVERLAAAYVSEGTQRGYAMPGHQMEDRRDAMQAALREFANSKPPKPDEPTGLGAVVEDESGDLWIRTCEPCDRCLNKPWQQGPVHKNWQIVDAVRVLSEGVTR